MSHYVSKLAEKIQHWNRHLYGRRGGALLVFLKIACFSLRTLAGTMVAGRPSRQPVNVGILMGGGLGDRVISTQWVMELIRQHGNGNVCFFLMYSGGTWLFKRHYVVESDTVRVLPASFQRSHRFDLLLELNQFVMVKSANEKRLMRHAPGLASGLGRARAVSLELCNLYYHEHHFALSCLCVLNGWSRYDLMGRCGLCNFGRQSVPRSNFDPGEVGATLERLGLGRSCYVTIHSGVGEAIDGRRATRCLPLSLLGALAGALRQELGEGIGLVAIGDHQSDHVPGVTMDLVGSLTLEDSLAVLHGAALHIDNDSGLVHIRHSMGKRSLVLWGPTRHEFVGYDSDINIQGGCSGCMWLTPGWNYSCPRGCPGEDLPCFRGIDPQAIAAQAAQAVRRAGEPLAAGRIP
ncbi:MAG: hypothetical protein K6A65_01555 [Succinivibrionaceae bacterium]|nr:hypothetical protein [Succinivibrionaceae bacterium]